MTMGHQRKRRTVRPIASSGIASSGIVSSFRPMSDLECSKIRETLGVRVPTRLDVPQVKNKTAQRVVQLVLRNEKHI